MQTVKLNYSERYFTLVPAEGNDYKIRNNRVLTVEALESRMIELYRGLDESYDAAMAKLSEEIKSHDGVKDSESDTVYCIEEYNGKESIVFSSSFRFPNGIYVKGLSEKIRYSFWTSPQRKRRAIRILKSLIELKVFEKLPKLDADNFYEVDTMTFTVNGRMYLLQKNSQFHNGGGAFWSIVWPNAPHNQNNISF